MQNFHKKLEELKERWASESTIWLCEWRMNGAIKTAETVGDLSEEMTEILDTMERIKNEIDHCTNSIL